MLDEQLPLLHRAALAQTREIFLRLKADQWDLSTPCNEWDVRTVANHLVADNYWVAPLVEGQTIAQVGDRYDGDVLGNDPLFAYDQSAKESDNAFSAPGALTAQCAVSYGPISGAQYCRHRLMDVVIHGWDIAEATKQDTNIPMQLIDACWEIYEGEKAMFRDSGYYGESQELPAGTDPQTRLLAAVGRNG